VIIALTIIYSSRAVRVVRSQSLSIKETAYIDASRAIGARHLRIILRHILPNTFGVVMVIATVTLGSAILLEASLSFLGVGMPVTVISWGGMLSGDILRNFAVAPWIGIFPGFALTAVVFGINVYGDALRDILDPKLRGR
jgi:peptide/nickel transport system permease protein